MLVWEVIESAAGNRQFAIILFMGRDALELGAGAVELRGLADEAGPTGIMPWDTNGDMAERKVHRKIG